MPQRVLDRLGAEEGAVVQRAAAEVGAALSAAFLDQVLKDQGTSGLVTKTLRARWQAGAPV
ncbi:hypothetical protein ABZW18_00655 [Streptomyces sp. NPDC004647]|uniref:hypothetical protein n=1 Tax=Streptomyces sp. NPDC004647 TaxID=3154671 RepID=UPI0033BAFFBF